ncbi:chromosomal replication initiator protein DnaA [Candidatus Uhrbacteria bacterium]|nr:chromosomal replication initiator protein DnaA [Candidatus Uhrbacteria bacterium]
MNTHELWQSVLGELELSLTKANFTTWFKNTFIVSITSTEAQIGVPNVFTKAWLEKKYLKNILQSLQNITDARIRSVHFKIDTKSQTPSLVTLGKFAEGLSPTTKIQTPPFPQQNDSSATYPVALATEIGLNKKYIFQNFIVGKQNELAHAAAVAVAGQPGQAYNPLFIYGGVGLGKTHLLQAIGHELIRRAAQARVLYVTCERFTNDFIHALRNNRIREFKQRYRTIDLLLVDDIQFIAGKEETQEEFFHTFNQLQQNNKQIVMTSDRPPKAIPSLEARLISRFESGMMTDVGSPDFETRVAILDLKCQERQFTINTECLQEIANAVQNNVRELEGALNKIIAYHQFKNVSPTPDTVRPIVASFKPTNIKKNVTPRLLIQTVASYFDVEHSALTGKSREKRFAFPRQIVMFLMREELKASYPSIGAELGGRDHTTAMHAYDKIQECLEENEILKHDLDLIKQRLYTSV